MRREFDLPPKDVEFLDIMRFSWEAVRDGRLGRLVIHGFPLPSGYKPDCVSLNFRIEPGYPDTQIDMVFFFPSIVRIDGKPIGALAQDAFDGKTWQRWSRHRTGQNPWRPGVDDVSTHLRLVEHWLNRELEGGHR